MYTSPSNQQVRFEFFYPIKRWVGGSPYLPLTQKSLAATLTSVALGVLLLSLVPVLGATLHYCGIGVLTASALTPLLIMGSAGGVGLILPCMIQQVVVNKRSPVHVDHHLDATTFPVSDDSMSPLSDVLKIAPPITTASSIVSCNSVHTSPHVAIGILPNRHSVLGLLDPNSAFLPICVGGDYVYAESMTIVGSGYFNPSGRSDQPHQLIVASTHHLYKFTWPSTQTSQAYISAEREVIASFKNPIQLVSVYAGFVAVVLERQGLLVHSAPEFTKDSWYHVAYFSRAQHGIIQEISAGQEFCSVVTTQGLYAFNIRSRQCFNLELPKGVVGKSCRLYLSCGLLVSQDGKLYQIDRVPRRNQFICRERTHSEWAGKQIKQVEQIGAALLILTSSAGQEDELFLWPHYRAFVTYPTGHVPNKTRYPVERLTKLSFPKAVPRGDTITIKGMLTPSSSERIMMHTGGYVYLIESGDGCECLYPFRAECQYEENCGLFLRLMEGVSPTVPYWRPDLEAVPGTLGFMDETRAATATLGALLSNNCGFIGLLIDDIAVDVFSFFPGKVDPHLTNPETET